MRPVRPSRRAVALASAALLGAAVLPALPALPALAAPPPGAWTAETAPPLTAPAALHGVAAASPNRAFAVGGEAGETVPVLLNRGPRGWTRAQAPAGIAPQLVDVAAGSAANAWAVGQSANAYDPADARAVHWNGRRWTADRLPLPTPLAVSVDSAGAPWVAGVNGNENDGSAVYTKRHGAWSKSLDVPAGTMLSAVAARTPRDVWTGGLAQNSTSTALYHFDGSAWTRVAWPSQWSRWVMEIAPVSAREVWLYEMPLDPLFSGPKLARWKNGAFTEYAIPPAGSGGGLGTLSADPGFLGSLAPDGRGGVWVQTNRGGEFLHFDGADWTRVARPASQGYLWDLAQAPHTRTVWAAGDGGALLRFH